MALNDLGVRFTEEKYLTKSELAKELKVPLVDNLWNKVLLYREQYIRRLNIKSITSVPLTICYSQTISSKLNDLDQSLMSLSSEVSSILEKNDNDAEKLRIDQNIISLRNVAKIYNLDSSNEHLKKIIEGKIDELSESDQILVNYLNALRFLENNPNEVINEDYLANIYSKIYNVEEIVSFYRENDKDEKNNRVLIDRVYASAPYQAIEPMMNSLFDFLSTSELPVSTKAIIAYYYFTYVKPFPKYNDEMALIMMKSILLKSGMNLAPIYLPIENILSEKLEENAKVSMEVQKTNDLTYFVNFASVLVLEAIREFKDYLASFNQKVIKEDFYQADIFEASNEDSTSSEETLKDEEAPKVVEEPVKETSKEVKKEKVIEDDKPVSTNEETSSIAVSYIPPVIDEKEASRVEEDLLESDPNLKKGEAYFYARHCTMKKCYTIQQYKKALGCAYETARTSMEHLAKLGYYEKQQIKNKFVYTPVLRK